MSRVLERLWENVVSFERVDTAGGVKFQIREECDQYYEEILSEDEMRELIRELENLVDGDN